MKLYPYMTYVLTTSQPILWQTGSGCVHYLAEARVRRGSRRGYNVVSRLGSMLDLTPGD